MMYLYILMYSILMYRNETHFFSMQKLRVPEPSGTVVSDANGLVITATFPSAVDVFKPAQLTTA